MLESDFTRLADSVFTRIEQTADGADATIDCNRSGAVLELEFENGAKIIVNRHTPNQEVWLAARSGGFHFAYRDGQWISQRDGCELYAKLGELVRTESGETLTF